MTPIAVTLLTGFLGAGKTTLLRHILNEQHGFKIAVIENEFGEVSVDDQLIGDRATQIKTLTNGCICCTRSSELEDALLDLLDSRDRGDVAFDRLVIECTGMADPGPIIQTFFSHEILCQRYLLDGVIALVDAVHADEQMNQFTIAQSQVGYADRILLTKTDVAGESEKLRERLGRINARAPIYTVTHGDINLELLFNTNGFMLEENITAKPRFHFIADKQNDVSSIVVELDYPVDISAVSRVMENLLLSFADKLLRYKGMLWIDGEPNRLLFQGVQRLYSADWDRPWGDEPPHSTLVFIGIQLPEQDIRDAFAGLKA
ncbi:TPA: GTPase [Kluyvera intermedia]|uniref:GTPase n=2 Tax=Enterobacteriaceae TaxID=543 RepID=A0A9P3T3X6_KLUIN|nr:MULTISPECIES: GTPase [Enterobacteriaceae]AKL13804.1 GTP-binding protein [Phytobacter ursingii]MCL9672741.1 GTPase [Citrobacter sp. MNAZ 1397]ORJ52078.1 GTPase [Kluyvera intermedia]HAT2203100.1 GTPase [Kluyvera intermedia]HAT2513813.1 GTPase [Kluyvera intermedia]